MENNVYFYMLIGIPGSGKSTFANKWKSNDNNISVVSSDVIRRNFENDSIQYTNNDVFNKMLHDSTFFLKCGRNVIYDATNVESRFRKKTIESIREYADVNNLAVNIVAMELPTPLDVCLAQNAMRSGVERVPENVIYRMFARYEIPETSEGFDAIIGVDEWRN